MTTSAAMTMPRSSATRPRTAATAGRFFAVALLALLAGGSVHAGTLIAGPDGVPTSVEQALQAARDGDTIELLPGDYRGMRVLIENRRLTLRGVGSRRPRFDGEGKVAAARALITVRGGDVTLQNLEFRGSRSHDAAGAGVRQEGGLLKLVACAFYDNEHGLVAANDPAAEIMVERSLFGLAPRVAGGLYHLINVGRIGRFALTGSRVQQGYEGHMVKSSARATLIAYNFIHDGTRGGASYEIDLPHGGLATVVGNVIGQSADSRNRVVLAYGDDGPAWDLNVLRVAHNTFINHKSTPAWFLRVWRDRLPSATQVVAVNNLLVGGGLFGLGTAGHFEGNRVATLGMLRDAGTYAFELPPDSIWRHAGVDPRGVRGHDLAPRFEFEWPEGMRALPDGATRWSPGAYQR